jgi:hypothetical protein
MHGRLRGLCLLDRNAGQIEQTAGATARRRAVITGPIPVAQQLTERDFRLLGVLDDLPSPRFQVLPVPE